MSHRLRIIVREDLSPGQQAVQGAHAQRQFASEHREVELEWFNKSNTLAMLSVPDETALDRLLRAAANKGIRASFFEEPDIGNRKTAICLEPSEEARRLCQGLPPALRGL